MWSKWSSCDRAHTQRRRRRCENPTTAGGVCVGDKLEIRKCSYAEAGPIVNKGPLPEFAWGSWSEWNEWGVCSCPANQRQRIRHCIGRECSGCGVEFGECERRCVNERWWSDWSEWMEGGRTSQ
ncbi:unnamed protein product [Heligmosomoides polygyrus]|uniref:Uncharacterized protein n=1 Tax=Heligmosomoides polygyrus TaxID=6339 RepID=A0A183GLY3_HELPZ|nr:unnamed protein product [Heligmosomoides polygyrus]